MSRQKDYHQAYVRLRSQATGEWLAHPDLRAKLVEDAAARGSNITEVAAEILAARFKIAYTPAGRRAGTPRPDADILNMRIPTNIWNALVRSRIKTGRPEMDLLRDALAEHYKLYFVA